MKTRSQKNVVTVFSVLYIFLFIYMMWQSLSDDIYSSAQSGLITAFLAQFDIFKRMEVNGVLDDFVRKFIGHYCEFALLGVFGYTIFYNAVEKEYSFLINCGVGLVSCAIIESLQIFADGRAPQFFDFILDFEGYLTALCIITTSYLLIKLIAKKDCSPILKKYLFSLPAFLIGILPFVFYDKGSFGIIFCYFFFISAFLISSLFAIILFLIKRKKSA